MGLNFLRLCGLGASLPVRPGRFFQLFIVPVQRLDQFERLVVIGGFSPCGLFTGSQIRFQAGVGAGKAPANHRCQLSRAHLASPLPTEPQTVPPKPLPGNRNGRGCGSGFAVARAEGLKVGSLRLITAWPFPEHIIRAIAPKVKGIVVAELNLGQMVREVERCAGGHCKVKLVGHAGGTVHKPEEILKAIQEVVR